MPLRREERDTDPFFYVSEASKVPKAGQDKGEILEKIFDKVLNDLMAKGVHLDVVWQRMGSHSDAGIPDFIVSYGDRNMGFELKNLKAGEEGEGMNYYWLNQNVLHKFDNFNGERYVIMSFVRFWKGRNGEEGKCVKALEERKIELIQIGQQIDTSRVYDDDMKEVYRKLMEIVCRVLGLRDGSQYLDYSRFAATLGT